MSSSVAHTDWVTRNNCDGKFSQWCTKRRLAKGAYLFNHQALAKVFRAKLLAAIAAAGLPLPIVAPGAP